MYRSLRTARRTFPLLSCSNLSKNFSFSGISQISNSFCTAKGLQEDKPLNYKDKMKSLFKKYGYFFVGTYLSIYFTTLGGIFVIFDSELLNASTLGINPTEAIKTACDHIENLTGWKETPRYLKESPRLSNLMLAWITTKFTEPLRLGVTVALTPTIAKFCRKSENCV